MIALGLLADPLIRYWRVISANPERGGMIPQAPRRPTGRGARKSREGRDREWLAGVVAMLHDVLEDADEEALAPVAVLAVGRGGRGASTAHAGEGQLRRVRRADCHRR